MFVPETSGDPDDGTSLFARSVGEELAEVVMVGVIQLILDDDCAVDVL